MIPSSRTQVKTCQEEWASICARVQQAPFPLPDQGSAVSMKQWPGCSPQ